MFIAVDHDTPEQVGAGAGAPRARSGSLVMVVDFFAGLVVAFGLFVPGVEGPRRIETWGRAAGEAETTSGGIVRRDGQCGGRPRPEGAAGANCILASLLAQCTCALVCATKVI